MILGIALGLFATVWYVGGQYLILRVIRADEAARQVSEIRIKEEA
jgi:hypothetical protein